MMQQKPKQGALLLYKSIAGKESLIEWTADKSRVVWFADKGIWKGKSRSGSPGVTLVSGEKWQHYNFSGVFKVEHPQNIDFGIIFYAKSDPNKLNASSYYYLRHTSKLLELFEHNAKGERLLARNSFPLTTQSWHDYRVQLHGNRVEYFVDDNRVFSYVGLKRFKGGIGFRFNNNDDVTLISKTRVQSLPLPPDTQITDILRSGTPLVARNNGAIRCGEHMIRWYNYTAEDVISATPWLLVSNNKNETLLEINEKKPVKSVVIQPYWCRDIQTNGIPALAYIHRNRMYVVSLQKPTQLIFTSNEYYLLPKQLDNTHAMELVGRYALFDRLAGVSDGDQPRLPVVWSFDGKQYRETTRQYPEVIRAELNEAVTELERTTGEKQKAVALRALGNYVLLGEPYKGLAHIRMHVSRNVASWLDNVARRSIVTVNQRITRQDKPPVQAGSHYASGFPAAKPSIEFVNPMIHMPSRPRDGISLDYVLWSEIRQDPVRRHDALLHVIQSWFGPEVHQWSIDAIKRGYMLDELFYLTCDYGKTTGGGFGKKQQGESYCHATISGSVAVEKHNRIKVYVWVSDLQRMPPFWLIHDPEQVATPLKAYTFDEIINYTRQRDKTLSR